jgi:hypothetical protein
MSSDLFKEFPRFFETNKHDFISFTNLKAKHSGLLSEIVGINISTINQEELEDKLKPHLPSGFSITHKGNSRYLYRLPITDFIINYACIHPALTINKMYPHLKMRREEFSAAIDAIIKSGTVDIFIVPQKNGFGVRIIPKDISKGMRPEEINTINDEIEEIKRAYSKISRGRNYVKIFEIRRYLKWPVEKFDKAIQKLWDDGVIDLQASSQNLLDKEEQRDSYLDKNNTLRILLLWRKG